VQTTIPTESPAGGKRSVFEGVTVYHWLVVIIASCGWLFDCMDQRFFTMARLSALKELLGSDALAQAAVEKYLNYATAAMMLGWGTGGIIFGMMSDKWGRVKTMIATLLVYSGFTGLSGLAQSWIDFTIFRFLVGLGVGGMFGAATTLVAESVPGGFRALALGSLQALSATGNLTATLISLRIPPGAERVVLGDFVFNHSGWRLLFFVGIVPSILAVPIMIYLREPEAWKKAKAEAKSGQPNKAVGSIKDLFRHPTWRRNTLVGLGLGVAGMVGLWGIGFFSPELISTALKANALLPGDLKNPAALVGQLKAGASPAAVHFQKQLSPALRTRLAAADTNALGGNDLLPSLVSELDRVIHGPSLYDSRAFAGLNLTKATSNLLNQALIKPREGDIPFLNRQLLEQSFPGTISPLHSFIDKVRSKAMLGFDLGALAGMFVFTYVASRLNRRIAFLGSFVACLAISAFVFYALKTERDAYWMLPLMGFAQLALFAGYSIYFPELYPTRLRGAGVGFCYNTVRYLTVPFNILMGHLAAWLDFRTAAIILSGIYLIGVVTLIWAPETKDKPLPEG
jgi:MFS family permease